MLLALIFASALPLWPKGGLLRSLHPHHPMNSPHLPSPLHARCSEGANYMDMTHSLASSLRPQDGAGSSAPSSSLRVHVVQLSANYCARVADVASYGEVNREVRAGGCSLE